MGYEKVTTTEFTISISSSSYVEVRYKDKDPSVLLIIREDEAGCVARLDRAAVIDLLAILQTLLKELK